MAFGNAWDNMNYGSQDDLFNKNYDDQQFNSLGQPLSQTPLNNGATIANDYSNDQRTAFDFKQQLRQANADTLTDEQKANMLELSNGEYIDKIDDSHLHVGLQAAGDYLDNYIAHMGDMYGAIAAGSEAAGKSVSDVEDKIKRQDMLKDLSAKTDQFGNPLYNTVDLAKWRDTGNTRDMIENQGKWTSDGNGWMHNTLTGQSRQITGYQSATQIKPMQVNLGDRVALIDPTTGNEIQSLAKGVTPTATSSMSLDDSGGDGTGTGSGVPTRTDEYGNVYHWEAFQKGGGKWVAVSNANQKQIREAATANAPDANQQLVSGNLQTLQALPDSEIEKFTGHIISKSDAAQGAYAEAQGPEALDHLAKSKQLSVQMGNAAIAAAKSAGASGINTEAELKRFTAGVPQVRYTSVEDYKKSLQEIDDYANKFRNDLIRSKGGKSASSQPATQGGVITVKRDANGKLVIGG